MNYPFGKRILPVRMSAPETRGGRRWPLLSRASAYEKCSYSRCRPRLLAHGGGSRPEGVKRIIKRTVKKIVNAAVALTGIATIFTLRRHLQRARPRLAVLLGAGFSQALGIPGTRELTEMLDQHYAMRKQQVTGDTHAIVFQRLAADLRSEFQESYNFEVLLDSAEASRQFLGPLPYLRPKPQSSLRPIMQLQQWLPSDGLEILDRIMETAYMLIRDALQVAQSKVTHSAMKLVRSFFDSFAKKYRVACINLNYDETVDESVPYLDTRFHLEVPNIEGKAFDASFVVDDKHHQMAHLHGSIYYRFPEMAGTTMVRNPDAKSAARQAGFLNTSNGGIHAGMISGLAKSEKLLRPPYNGLYYWATDVLMRTPRVVICGYGVGDLHLNVWLAQAAIAHGDAYRLCFITRSDNLDNENQRLQGLLSIAAGFRYTADVPSLERLLKFDKAGFATHKGLAVLRSGFPHDRKQLRIIMPKVLRFLG